MGEHVPKRIWEPAGQPTLGMKALDQAPLGFSRARFTPSSGWQNFLGYSKGTRGQWLSHLQLLLRNTWGALQIRQIPQLSIQPLPAEILVQ